MIFLYLWIAQAEVVPPTWLAPTREQFLALLTEAEVRLADARAIEVAVARTHNNIAELLSRAAVGCDHPQVGRYPAAERFLIALSQAAQTARAAWQRVARLRRGPTVAPLLGSLENQRLEQLQLEVKQLEKRYLELHVWHLRHVLPVLDRCQSAMVPLLGLPGALRAANDPRLGVAISGVGEGVLCPNRVPATQVAITDGQACYGAWDCGCTPVSVAPGAILGP